LEVGRNASPSPKGGRLNAEEESCSQLSFNWRKDPRREFRGRSTWSNHLVNLSTGKSAKKGGGCWRLRQPSRAISIEEGVGLRMLSPGVLWTEKLGLAANLKKEQGGICGAARHFVLFFGGRGGVLGGWCGKADLV